MKHFLRGMYVFVAACGAYAIYVSMRSGSVPVPWIVVVEVVYGFAAGIGFSLMGDGGSE